MYNSIIIENQHEVILGLFLILFFHPIFFLFWKIKLEQNKLLKEQNDLKEQLVMNELIINNINENILKKFNNINKNLDDYQNNIVEKVIFL